MESRSSEIQLEFLPACQMHPLHRVFVPEKKKNEVCWILPPSRPRPQPLMRDAWMSRGIPECAVREGSSPVPSADAALRSGYERECEQGLSVTSWQQYKCSLNPCLLFVMTTDSARCSFLLQGFPMEAGVFSFHLHTQKPSTDY